MNVEKIMITGSSGFLGSRLTKHFSEHYEVIATKRDTFTLTDEASVMDFIACLSPDVVIHCAAISDTGYAQQHIEEHELMNVQVPYFVAKACHQIGAKMIFMSSDQIYNGNTIIGESYDVFIDEAIEGVNDCPNSVYADGKKRAEQLVLAACPNSVCLRLSWMFDVPREGMKTNTNIITNILNAMEENTEIFFATHEYRPMTYVQEVVEHMEQVFILPSGVYNYGSDNHYNSYEIAWFTDSLLKKIRYTGDVVVADEVRFVERPRNLTMSYDKIQTHGIQFSTTLEGIKSCLKGV